MRTTTAAWAVCCVAVSCAPQLPPPGHPTEAVAPSAVFTGKNELRLGEPLALAVDFAGRAVIADGSPGRILRWRAGNEVEEFTRPRGHAGFYPTDIVVQGFFVYAVDEPSRKILRFDDDGAYRDVLLSFDAVSQGRRVSPYSVAVDGSGRLAVTDTENHQVLLFDAYLELESAFGNYGSYQGQLDTPMGVSFSGDGDIVVADTGNRRVQWFTSGGAFQRTVPAEGQVNPLRRPRRVAVDDDGRTYVADPVAGAVFVFGPSGALERAVAPEGAGRFAPTDVVRTRTGDVYVADEANRSVYLFRGI